MKQPLEIKAEEIILEGDSQKIIQFNQSDILENFCAKKLTYVLEPIYLVQSLEYVVC